MRYEKNTIETNNINEVKEKWPEIPIGKAIDITN
jgi:hypothetical protein